MNNRIFPTTAIVLVVAAPVASHANDLVSTGDWSDNAKKIFELRGKYSSDAEFSRQFLLYQSAIALAYANEVNPPDRGTKITLITILFFNNNLLTQFMLDKKNNLPEDIFKDYLSRLALFKKSTSDLMRSDHPGLIEYIYRTKMREQFNQSFDQNPEFTLRTLY